MRSGSGGGVRAASSDTMADTMAAMPVSETTAATVDLDTKVESSSDTTIATSDCGALVVTAGSGVTVETVSGTTIATSGCGALAATAGSGMAAGTIGIVAATADGDDDSF